MKQLSEVIKKVMNVIYQTINIESYRYVIKYLVFTSNGAPVNLYLYKILVSTRWITFLYLSNQSFVRTYVDLIVIHLSCSSFRVSVKRVSPALAPAIIPAFDTRESVNVDFPWSTWAMTDMLRMFFFLSIMVRISSTVKFTYKINKFI